MVTPAQQPHAPDRHSACDGRARRADMVHFSTYLWNHLRLAASDVGRYATQRLSAESENVMKRNTALRLVLQIL